MHAPNYKEKGSEVMNENKPFKPYIPADKVTPELTVTSILVGVILAVVFGAANAYLGLRVGLTVSASIPAAVLSMGIIRVLMRRNSILESNIVQTIGSAGESLAAGAIFTLPALFLWAAEGLGEKPSLVEITVIALCGGLLGVFFMVPLRNALIVREHATLPYPEGTACAEVLLAGEEGGSDAVTVFSGMGISAVFKLIVDGFKVIPSEINYTFKSFGAQIGTQVYPALIGVGYIVGPRISSFMFVGGVIGWCVLIPLVFLFGADAVIYPGTDTIANIFAASGPSGIWGSYIRYIGAGAIATGGFISLIKSFPLICRTFADSMKSMRGGAAASLDRTSQDLSMKIILAGVVVTTLVIWLFPGIPVNLIGAILIVIFGFFFATVSSRMVGLVGSTNNPVSGMAIATLIISTLVLKSTGMVGIEGMTGAIAIGSVICVIAAIAGDTSQDLKTGYLLGATPKKQQIGEIIGVVASAFAIGGVLYLLDAAWGFDSPEISAPQANLMKMLVEGIMGNQLPWGLIFVGVCLALCFEILRLPVMPIAVGIYLPVQLNACIMVGGLIALLMDRRKKVSDKVKAAQNNDGTLYCAGMIAGEGLVGIALAILAVFEIDPSTPSFLDAIRGVTNNLVGSAVVLALVILSLLKFSLWGKNKAAK